PALVPPASGPICLPPGVSPEARSAAAASTGRAGTPRAAESPGGRPAHPGRHHSPCVHRCRHLRRLPTLRTCVSAKGVTLGGVRIFLRLAIPSTARYDAIGRTARLTGLPRGPSPFNRHKDSETPHGQTHLRYRRRGQLTGQGTHLCVHRHAARAKRSARSFAKV